MAGDFGAAPDYLEMASPVANGSFSMSIRFRVDDIASRYYAISVGRTDVTTNWFGIRANGQDVGDPVDAIGRIGNNPATASSSGGLVVDTWFHAGAHFDDGGDEFGVAFNGETIVTVAQTGAQSADFTTLRIGALAYTSVVQPIDGKLAESAIWNEVLTQADYDSLNSGVAPTLVKAHALVFYAQLIGGVWIDLISGTALTENGTVTAADHPPIAYPVLPWPGVTGSTAPAPPTVDYLTGCEGFWSGNQATGDDETDDSSNGYDLTQRSSPPAVADLPSGLVGTTSRDLNGVNENFYRLTGSGIANLRPDGTADFCFATWCKPDALSTVSTPGTREALVSLFDTGTDENYILSAHNNQWRWECCDTNSTSTEVATADGYTDSAWHLVVVTYRASDGRIGLSVDGGSFNYATHSAQDFTDGGLAPFNWGCTDGFGGGGTYPFDGHLASMWAGSIELTQDWVDYTWNDGNGRDMTPSAPAAGGEGPLIGGRLLGGGPLMGGSLVR